MRYTLQKIEFCRSTEDVSRDYIYLSDIDKIRISQLEILSSFDYQDNHGNYNCFLLISNRDIITYLAILEKNFIPHFCHDVSKVIIQNKTNLEKYLNKYLDRFNKESHIEFIEEVNMWIQQNLNLDIILDMISEKGIESLRPMDKEYLSKV